MKKLGLVLVSAILFAACSGKEQSQAEQQTKNNFPPCTINGHDCLEVLEMIHRMNIEYIDKNFGFPWEGISLPTWDNYQYNSPKLESLGLKVIRAEGFDDGGSSIYILSNGINIYNNQYMGTPNPRRGFTTFSWPNGQEFVFNDNKDLVSYTSAQQTIVKKKDFPPCTINGQDCKKIIELVEHTKIIRPTKEEIEQYIETHFTKTEVPPIAKKISQQLQSQRKLQPPHNINATETKWFSLKDYKELSEVPQKLTLYENPELQKTNLIVTNIEEGENTRYILSNGVTISKKWDLTKSIWRWDTIVSFPSGETFVFDNEGKITQHTPPQEEKQNN